MNLEEWVKNNWLTKQLASPQEIKDLLNVAERDLKDCQITNLSLDARFNLAYNSALQLANIALRACRYRVSKGERSHYYVIQSLALTIGLDKENILNFEAFRKKRHESSYEVAGNISGQEVIEITEFATKLRNDVEIWLKSKHPELLK